MIKQTTIKTNKTDNEPITNFKQISSEEELKRYQLPERRIKITMNRLDDVKLLCVCGIVLEREKAILNESSNMINSFIKTHRECLKG